MVVLLGMIAAPPGSELSGAAAPLTARIAVALLPAALLAWPFAAGVLPGSVLARLAAVLGLAEEAGAAMGIVVAELRVVALGLVGAETGESAGMGARAGGVQGRGWEQGRNRRGWMGDRLQRLRVRGW